MIPKSVDRHDCLSVPIRFVAGDFGGEGISANETRPIRLILRSPQVTEELMLRYGLMTFLVWVGAKVWVTLPPALCLGVVVFSAVLLGAGHLPAMAALTPLTPLVIMRTVGLNALRGFAFGWLFWRRGLEHVMDAHIATHLSFWAFAAVL